MALLSGVACWFWALPQLAPGRAPAIAADGEMMDEVASDDIPAALGAMGISNALIPKLADEARKCSRRLAWVAIAKQPNGPPGIVQIQSGAYQSPPFTLTDTPMRVAIPYPTPYVTGRGTLTVLTTGSATVALTPPWHVSLQDGKKTRTVTWSPAESCGRGNG
jgi:hypothetical protein